MNNDINWDAFLPPRQGNSGNWASAWLAANQPQRNFGERIFSGFADSAMGAGNRIANSTNDAFTALQNALTLQAPSRNAVRQAQVEADAQRDVAREKYGSQRAIGSALVNALNSAQGSQLGGFQTDYGASATLPEYNAYQRYRQPRQPQQQFAQRMFG